MESNLILIDTSILIDFFRKTDKENATLVKLTKQGYTYSISSITDYEIYTGAALGQIDFWTTFLNKIEVLPFTKETSAIAVTISQELKRKRKQISIPDLFIAATAKQNNLAIATLNKKDFE